MLALFNSTWDWTAVGTLTLAIVTGVSLAFGWGSLKQTQEGLAQSRAEVEEAHRPVVVPVADLRDVPVGDGDTRRAQPLIPKPGWLLVPIENIGPGPALSVEVLVDRHEHAREDPYYDRGWASGLGSGRMIALAVKVSYGLKPPSEVEYFNVTITYADVAGKRWSTTATWNPTPGLYEKIAIGQLNEA